MAPGRSRKGCLNLPGGIAWSGFMTYAQLPDRDRRAAQLRQICCDPGLLKTAQAARVKESAKLALLLDKLPELIE